MNRTKIEDFIEELKSLSNRYHEGYVIHKHELDELIERHSTSLLAEDEGEGWISVEERLPESHDLVLCYYMDGNEDSSNWKFVWGFNFPFEKGLTHWMPLPKAPSHTKGEGV